MSHRNIRVSFRDDVVFPNDNNNDLDTKNNNNKPESSSNNDNDSHSSFSSCAELSVTSNSSSKVSSSNNSHFSNLRSNLTRELTNRDPFVYYQVTKNLGSGSMGDVKLVKKRWDKIGGSARRDLQQQQQQQPITKCLELPFFRWCIDDGSITATTTSGSSSPSFDKPGESSHHSTFSMLSMLSIGSNNNNNNNNNNNVVGEARSFEDSFLLLDDDSNNNNNKNHNNNNMPGGEIIYAMKSLHLDRVMQDKVYLNELRNEIAILRDLDHPNIVRAIETFEWQGKISIVMELCAGGDLYTRDPYTEPEAARIMSFILGAIAYMHSRKVVHRDLKFENILFVNQSPLSEVKLIDFGLSKIYLGGKEEGGGGGGLTDISGTIYTMAPEVLKGSHTEKADMWSIGVLAVMLLSSSLPFYGNNSTEVMKRIMANNYKFKARRWKFVSQEAKDFVKRLLVTNPNDRWDAETALKSEWLQNQSVATTSSSPHGIQRAILPEEEDMARAAMMKYAGYPKLKKMALMVIAHKSSSEQIGILRKLFKKYDSHHDGTIWFEEFCESMSGSSMSKEELRFIFDAMDLSGSGGIRYTEFIAATIEAQGDMSEARLAEAFDRLDCDDSGYITATNLAEILGDVPMDEIDAIIAEAGRANNDRVSYNDFLLLWEDKDGVHQKESQNDKILGTELSTISADSESSKNSEVSDEYAEFLKAKHLQNTLHTWAMEMQLPAQQFAKGCSFLHQVALGNEKDVHQLVQEQPGLVNFRDYDRRTALHIAASEGHVDICKYLVKKGARVNRSDRWGGFPLDDAHRHHQFEVINLLRQHGAKFGTTSQVLKLITAASEGNTEEVKTLLEFGSINLNQGDYDHRTALHLATNEGHLEVVKLLCKAGADINVKDRWGSRPLDDAKKAKKNSSAITDILNGVDVHVTEKQPATISDLNLYATNQATISEPTEQKSEGMTQLPASEFAMGCSVLHQAAMGHQLVLKSILLAEPTLANFQDYDRRTPLHLAASEGHLDICQLLVEHGSRVNRVDRWGRSPLDDAHQQQHSEIIKFLRGQGAKFGSTSGVTNFITAASEGDTEEVQAFLDFGSIDVNRGDYDNRTALHLAAGEGHMDVVKLLCSAGADVNVRDRWGHSPLDEARKAKTNSVGIMKLLLNKGAKSTKLLTMIKASLVAVLPSGQS